MSVILRHAPSGYYYGGPRWWVAERERALDLGTIEIAIEASREVGYQGMEAIVGFGEPECDWVLSVSRAKAGSTKTADVGTMPAGSAPGRVWPGAIASCPGAPSSTTH